MPSYYRLYFTFQCACYQEKINSLEKTLNQNYQSIMTRLSHMMRIDLASFVLKSERSDQCTMQYFTLSYIFFQNNLYEVWWVLYPGNIFLVDLYHETLGPGASMGSYPFPFGINFFLVSMRNPIFWVARDQASIPGVNRVLSPRTLWMFFVCQQKFSEKHNFFSIV